MFGRWSGFLLGRGKAYFQGFLLLVSGSVTENSALGHQTLEIFLADGNVLFIHFLWQLWSFPLFHFSNQGKCQKFTSLMSTYMYYYSNYSIKKASNLYTPSSKICLPSTPHLGQVQHVRGKQWFAMRLEECLAVGLQYSTGKLSPISRPVGSKSKRNESSICGTKKIGQRPSIPFLRKIWRDLCLSEWSFLRVRCPPRTHHYTP